MSSPATNPPAFDVNQVLGNAGAVYLGESLMMGTIMPNEKQIQQTIRAGLANGLFQSGFMVAPIAKVLSSFGVSETKALQAVFQGLVMAGMDQMMPRTRVGYQTSFIEGAVAAYAGDALAKSIAPIKY